MTRPFDELVHATLDGEASRNAPALPANVIPLRAA